MTTTKSALLRSRGRTDDTDRQQHSPSNEAIDIAVSFGLCFLDRHDLTWLPPSLRYQRYGRYDEPAKRKDEHSYKRSDDVTLVLDSGIVTLGPTYNGSSDTDKQ
jgi:hypothetical protein